MRDAASPRQFCPGLVQTQGAAGASDSGRHRMREGMRCRRRSRPRDGRPAYSCHSCAGGNTQVPAPLLQSQTGPVPARLASCPVPGPQRLGLPRAGNWTRTLQIWELGAGLRASAVLLSRLWGRGHEMASREAPSCRWSLSSRSVAGGPREKKKHVREGGRRRWGQGVRVSRPGAKVGRSLEASHRTYRSPIYAPAGYNAINNM